MPKINFQRSAMVLNAQLGDNLMQTLVKNGIPVASSCSGDGICAKCKIEIHTGMENLSEPNSTELLLIEKNSLDSIFRIACQCQILGDVTLNAGYW